ncbi:hypothetical protein [Azospirillum canadense]|uniref:hypothetical protein n=1 Tax=Azospirillum canadense TaxID=403962 RepID=UPI00222682CB|nr:hypothetical protein [Azospirillum canadense]MCW2242249.1 hypothetical protein [Azospirillum canadense]
MTVQTPTNQNLESLPAICPGQTITVPIGAGNQVSPAIAAGAVRLFATATCFVACGDAPDATANGFPLGTEAPELFGFTDGQKIAVIGRSGGTGTLFVTPAL